MLLPTQWAHQALKAPNPTVYLLLPLLVCWESTEMYWIGRELRMQEEKMT